MVSGNSATTKQKTRKIVIPFVNTHPTADIGIMLTLLPVWWVLGLEQFIWLILLPLSIFKIPSYKIKRLKNLKTFRRMSLFVVAHVISFFFILENLRYITFARNLSTYLIAIQILLIISSTVRSWKQIEFILHMLVGAVFVAGLIGLLGASDFWQPDFISPFGQILPSSIRNTTYGGLVASRSIGNSAWFSGLGTFFRITSVFLFATHYATALCVTIPICCFFIHVSTQFWKKLAFSLVCFVLVINLIYTTGRIATIGLLIGIAYYLLFYTRARTLYKMLGVLGVGIIVILVMLSPELIVQTYEGFIFARGTGSYNTRLFVYQESFKGFLERPIFGWGTERDILLSEFSNGVFKYPAGSHSYYLGMLYKHGIIGFIFFVGTLMSLWKETSPIVKNKSQIKDWKIIKLLQYGRWSLIVFLFNSFTDVLDLDAITMVVMWVIFSSLIGAKLLLNPSYKMRAYG